MNPSQTKSERHRQKRSERRRRRRMEKEASAASTMYVPDDLIKEVFSFLPVKSLIRLKCVSKPFNSFISDPTFIKKHLIRSSQRNTNLTFLITYAGSLSFTVVRMLDNPQVIIVIALPNDPYHQLYRHCMGAIGSCNGLICLFFHSYRNNESWFRFWNPATRIISDKLGSCDDGDGYTVNFTFGYDSSKDTFKVVRFFPETTEVRVFSLNDNVWRNIQNSPVVHHDDRPIDMMEFVHFSDTVNWLVICNYSSDDDYGDYYDYLKNISIEQFVIISLDLQTETHTKLLPPRGFNEVRFDLPNLSVLNDCLCFSHDSKRTHFIIWKMKEFGVEDSWSQFLKISYHDLQLNGSIGPYPYFSLLPLCLSEKNDTLLLTNKRERRAILYNWRDNSARRIDNPLWLRYGKDYVESLVSYC